ncbi:MAG: hypothetical protein ACI9F9_000533 [Candidatus Paceibacteria bacterium]|jgi:hypothetical protein
MSDGAVFCLVHIPGGTQIYHDSFEGTRTRAGDQGASFKRDHPEAKLLAISEQIGARYHSLVPAMLAATPSASTHAEEEWLYYNGGGHWNVTGNALAAESLPAKGSLRQTCP